MNRALLVLAVLAGLATPGLSQPDTKPEPVEEGGARWSLTLGGGALAPVGEMRDGYQEALVAGVRLGVRARVGIGVQLGVDYSPLPRRSTMTETFDTTYGTVALGPSCPIGHGTLRLQLGAGGGVALESVSVSESETTSTTESALAGAALAQVGLELHVTKGGGLVVLGGATRTFGDREYQYAWGMGGLTLEF
jgi:hypothetical protein